MRSSTPGRSQRDDEDDSSADSGDGTTRADSGRASAGSKDRPSIKPSIGVGPQVGKQMMAAAALLLGSEGRQVDRADEFTTGRPGSSAVTQAGLPDGAPAAATGGNSSTRTTWINPRYS
jgi:hypothetical protein